ncbi:MAG: aminodeoxychorismate synthase component I [Epsilonproteobacteria bacterium]|nr:aminodeoxychorismate synthase component I [Campylobacterota bacterium]
MDLRSTLNYFGSKREPCFFCISYNLDSWDLIPLKDLPHNIKFSIEDLSQQDKKNHFLEKKPLSFNSYKKKFNLVIKEIEAGNTYLLNLTSKTTITSEQTLIDIYKNSFAKYKLYYKDKFVSFSPETFIKISNNTIFTFPMKGTIDASIESAEEKILQNQKELAEHTMIVDLLRNDLNIVSKNVKVENFRYIDEIHAGKKKLLQVSSKISGELDNDWHSRIGDILVNILPAGSITGTPKKKTIDIIQNIEKYPRGYFSGIWGIYDGVSLDSAVLIRFIEKTKNKNKFIYKSGGGITIESNPTDEYNEMIDKVYIP